MYHGYMPFSMLVITLFSNHAVKSMAAIDTAAENSYRFQDYSYFYSEKKRTKKKRDACFHITGPCLFT